MYSAALGELDTPTKAFEWVQLFAHDIAHRFEINPVIGLLLGVKLDHPSPVRISPHFAGDAVAGLQQCLRLERFAVSRAAEHHLI